MAFTVEDGTGKADANAYIDTTFADTYFSDRGVTAWTGSSTVKQQAVIKATDYIDTVFGGRFIGNKKLPDTQALEFPRFDPDYADNVATPLPLVLQKACAEYALRALTASLFQDPTVDASGQVVIREKIGPLETEYANLGATPLLIKPYPAADKLLTSLLRPAGAYR